MIKKLFNKDKRKFLVSVGAAIALMGGGTAIWWVIRQNTPVEGLPVGSEVLPQSTAMILAFTTNENQWQQLQQFGTTAQSVTKAANNVTTLVQDNRTTLIATLGNLQDTSKELKVAVKSLSPILSRVEKGKLLENLEIMADNGAKASANLKSLSTTLNNPVTLLGLAQTLDSARVTFQNTQKITTELDQVTGDPQFRQNLIKLINGLSKLVSSAQTLDQQLTAVRQGDFSTPVAHLAMPQPNTPQTNTAQSDSPQYFEGLALSPLSTANPFSVDLRPETLAK